jgi:hypothetical protein
MRIIVEIDETQTGDYGYSINNKDGTVIIYDKNQGLMIEGIFSEYSKEAVELEIVKTSFVLTDILEFKKI